jgi:serine/threonine protein kinase
MPSDIRRIVTFGFEPGRVLAGKYVVNELLGRGWEGEVYHVSERATGVERAAKVFFPARNPNNKTLLFYAKMLDKLRKCSIVVQYHTQETFRYRGHVLPMLVSEYVEGELLPHLVARQPGKRLHHFEALHLFYALVKGVEEIHKTGEYHGDLHSANVIVRRVGLGFSVHVVDMYFWGRRTASHVHHDIACLIRILYDILGGAKHYSKQPPEIKGIILGLKQTLIRKKFRDATRLREYLERLPWNT